MITFEQEKKRTGAMLRNLDKRLLKERFANVQKVVITYTMGYGRDRGKEKTITIGRDNPCSATVIECMNTECTCGYVYIDKILSAMIAEGKAEQEGKEFCTGRDAFNYSYQCRTYVDYKIEVTYR